jgi:hypothetical protein
MSEIAVETAPVRGGWVARVIVADRHGSREFEVGVTREELARYAPAATDPTDLIQRSFVFLLAREPKESILSSFGLSVIAHYFPEYEREIRSAG